MSNRAWLGMALALLVPASAIGWDWGVLGSSTRHGQDKSSGVKQPCNGPTCPAKPDPYTDPCWPKRPVPRAKKKCHDYEVEITPLSKINAKLSGRIVDHTSNHGADRRIFSPALLEWRDVYVYLPPGYDRQQFYPVMFYLHGILDDERGFMKHIVPVLDRAIVEGKLPPIIAVAPDGSLSGDPDRYDAGSFFINGPAGNFHDYIVQDVWNFMMSRYSVRPEPEAHIIAGVSMGGFGAFNIAIKHPEQFKVVIGAMPVLNLRWMDSKGNAHADFDPYNWGWRNSAYDPQEVLGKFANGLIKVRMKDVMYPVFGTGPEAIFLASQENPIEMIDRYRTCCRQLQMYVAYGGCDEFNLDAQAESFLYLLKSRGIPATVYVDPEGTHSEETAKKILPGVVRWLNHHLRTHKLDQPWNVPMTKVSSR